MATKKDLAEELAAKSEELRVQKEELRRVTEALRQSEEHYHSLFDNMLNGFAYCKMHYERNRPVDFTYLSVNHAFETLTGLKNVIGKKVSEVIPGIRESDPELFEIYGRVALTGMPEQVERYLKALGMWLSISVYSPQKEHFAAVFDVITERKQAEGALLRAKNEWERTFDAVPDLIAIMDDDHHFVRVNRAMAEVVGAKQEDLAGKSCYEYMHQTACPLPNCPHNLLLQDGREHASEFREWDRDFLVTVSPLLDDSGRLLGSVHVARDITARKQGEEALQRNHDELELRVRERTAQLHQTVMQLQEEVLERQRAEQEVSKLNAELEQRVRERTSELEFANRELESFSYSVSHDLKAPIRAIQGFSRMLVGEHAIRLDQEGHRLLDVICKNTRIMAKLIDDLLALSRLGRHQVRKSPVNLAEMACQDFKLLQSQEPERDLRLTVQDLPQAWGDRSLINQVVMNLLGNAIKYTRARKIASIEVGGYTEGQETIYYVKDNGIGFDERYAHKLFGVFQRLHGGEEYEGTGVGLAIVQRIIQRHGGRVLAEGKPGGGAAFYFTLPRKGE